MGNKAGVVGLGFVTWEFIERGGMNASAGTWTMYGADVVMVIVGIACPVCGIVYDVGRLGVEAFGIDAADELDNLYGR